MDIDFSSTEFKPSKWFMMVTIGYIILVLLAEITVFVVLLLATYLYFTGGI
jgi:hypothetical protein